MIEKNHNTIYIIDRIKSLRIKYKLLYIPIPIYIKFKCEYKNISRDTKIGRYFVGVMK